MIKATPEMANVANGSEPKYKPGDIVQIASLDGSGPVDSTTGMRLSKDLKYRVKEINGDGLVLEPYREPLRAEFECEWEREGGGFLPIGKESGGWANRSREIHDTIAEFDGKRTKVTIVEIV